MRIAYIVPSLANKGPIIVVKNLVEVMTQNGNDCVVYYFDDKEELVFDCETIKISMTSRIDFSSFDVVHSHGLRPDAYVFFHKPIKCRAKCISTMHSFVFQDLSSQYNKLIGFAFGWVMILQLCRHDSVFVLSRVAKQYYSRFISPKKLEVAYNTTTIDVSIDLSEEERNELLAFKSDSLLLGVNALLTPIKGIDQIIRALPKVSNTKLCIAGDGKSMSDLKSLSHSLNVDDRILFLGYKQQAFRYLPYYDIYVMSSRSEGFPLCMIEAVKAKCKVICSDISLFTELWTEKEVSFFELENIDSLVDAINSASKVDTTEAAFAKYQELYSSNALYNSHLRMYSSTF